MEGYEIINSKLASAKEKAECIATYYEEVNKEMIPLNDKSEKVMETYEDVQCNTNSISIEGGSSTMSRRR